MPDIIELLKNAAKVAEYKTEVEQLRAENEQLRAALAKAQPEEATWLKGRGANFRRRFP